MNYLMLRGLYPKDRKHPDEIFHDSIQQENDVWTELLYAMMGSADTGTVAYLNGPDRERQYGERFRVVCGKFDHNTPVHFIIARGGFKEYNPVLAAHPHAVKVYYGAGVRYIPAKTDFTYDMILVDCEEQRKAVLKVYPFANVQLMVKPASHIFHPVEIRKQYDFCFVAIHPSDPRKNVRWVYETVPRSATVLQLGNAPTFKVPPNVTVKHIAREKMPKAMSKCRVGICPYTADDSCPRVVPEFMACGLPVVALKDVSINKQLYLMHTAKKEGFWEAAAAAMHQDLSHVLVHYAQFLNLPAAAEVMRYYLEGMIHE